MVFKGYTALTIIGTDGKVTLKPAESWDKAELQKSRWNNEGLNAIQCCDAPTGQEDNHLWDRLIMDDVVMPRTSITR